MHSYCLGVYSDYGTLCRGYVEGSALRIKRAVVVTFTQM
jgi:hypothetical protein